MRRVELLAPAGNKDAFFAAINNGADAIYMGGKNFSARAFAENFSEDDFKELIEFAHLRSVKVYVTLNTLLDEYEFNNAIKDVEFYYKNNVDALIIQDLGLYYYIKNNYPDFELHASTQMHVHNLAGVEVARKLGFNRVVLARESSLELIKQATNKGIEIEVFVHGAICVSYSGQCLLSSSINNRSANKGMCAQCCRLKYDLLDKDLNIINTNTKYLLSPKDMFLLNEIPDLIEAGVDSFKIEGRMKSSAYVGYITRMYRKAIDAYYSNKKYKFTNEEINNMKVLFNRGYTNSYLLNNNDEIFNNSYPNHQGILIGKVVSSNNKRVQIKLENNLNQFDGIRIISKKAEDGFIVNKLYKNRKLVNKACKNDVIEVESSKQFKNGDHVLKTLDKYFEDEINSTKNKYLPLNLEVDIFANKEVIIKTSDFIYRSKIIAENSHNAPLTYDSIFKQFSKLKETPYFLDTLKLNTDHAFLRNSIINNIRNEFIEDYNKFRLNCFKRNANKPQIDINYRNPHYKETKDLILNNSRINQYYFNNVINTSSKYSNDNQVITEIGGLLNNHQKIAFYTLNIANSYAYDFLDNLGFNAICLSTELTNESIDKLIDSYYKRTNIHIKPYILYKGYRTLMYIRRDPFKEYENAKYIQINNKRMLIKKNNDYIELIEEYNGCIETKNVNHLIIL